MLRPECREVFESTLILSAANPCQVPSQPIRVGCAGWNIPRQAIAHFASAKNHLERYSQVLNCCEINSSFYRPHKMETWERWAQTVPAGFHFSVKAPRAITHEAKLNCRPEMLLAFLQQIKLLRDNWVQYSSNCRQASDLITPAQESFCRCFARIIPVTLHGSRAMPPGSISQPKTYWPNFKSPRSRRPGLRTVG